MSFGFGVGDFLAIIQLANKIRKDFVEAPAQLRDLSDEVRNLSIVVQDLEVELSGKELDRAQEAELCNIVQSCRSLLNDIQKLVGQYSELKHDYCGNKVIRAWKRLRWEPIDAQYLRTRIGSQVSLLNAFNGRVLRSNVSKLMDYQERQEQERILDWLSPVNYASKQSELTRRRQPDSGHWFLQSSKLQTWLTMPEQTLFCYGIPGAGKTMLTSALIEELESRYGTDANIYIVIDGLDELRLATYSLDLLIDELLAFHEACGLNLLVTTRLIPEIAAKFRHKPAIEIRANEEDVTAYLRSSIPKLPSFVLRNPELQNDIISWIAKITDGMFLLADLYLNSLVGKTSPKAIRLALKDISMKAKTYDAAYDNVMERIEGQTTDKRNMAMHILSWITCAQRSITAVELQHALAVEVDESYFDEDNMPDLNEMFTVCAGLVVQDPSNNIIRFAHHTSYEYFNQTKDRWFPNAHCNIATTCVTYLSYDAFGSGPCLTDADFEWRLTQFPLYSYAATNWGHHAQEKLSDERLVSKFLISPAKLNASMQALFARNTVEGSRRLAWKDAIIMGRHQRA
ncbi:hypothetical protein AtubIFM61612_006078 [Aspergillus tubingensis]|nr:hypothetical protein AtubIFM61612_006078 [Aspergillus tubingensis]